MAEYTALINGGSPGEEWKILREGLTFTQRASGIGTLTCQVLSDDGSPYFRPEVGQEFFLLRDGTPIWGGHIVDAPETGFGGPNLDQIVTTITANDFNAIAQRRYLLNTTIPAGSLKSFAQVIATLLAAHGVTLGTMPDGPTLPEMFFAKARASEALDAFDRASRQGNSGWTHRIDADKVLTFTNTDPAGSPSEVNASPWGLIEGDGSEVGDLKVQETLTDQYANRVTVRSGTVTDQIDSFTGDGIADTFPLTSRILGPGAYHYDSTVGYAVVDYNGSESIGGVGAAGVIWEYDPAALTIRRRLGAPGNGDAFQIRYQTDYQPFVTANDAVEQGLRGIWEHVEDVAEVTGSTALLAIANAILRERAPHVTAEYRTRRAGLEAGQVQHITSERRNVDDDFLITEVTAQFDEGEDLVYIVVAEKTRVPTGTWEHTLAQWSRGSSATTPGFVATPGVFGGAPAPPDGAIQYRKPDATFGGADEWKFDDTDKVVTLYGADGTVISRGTNTGSNYGVENQKAILAALAELENVYAAVFGNVAAGLSKALAIWALDDGSVALQHNDVEGLYLAEYGGPLRLQGYADHVASGGAVIIGPSIGTTHKFKAWIRGVTKLNGVHVFTMRSTSTSLTVDGQYADTAVPTALLLDPSADMTVTLPALSEAQVYADSFGRLLFAKNCSASFTAILDGASSDTIDGAATLMLLPGQSVVLHAWNGTSPEWRVLASHTPLSLNLFEYKQVLTNTQIKALPTTSQNIVPSSLIPSGWAISDFSIDVQAKFSSGAYTNVDPDAYLVAQAITIGDDRSNYLANDADIPRAFFSDMFEAAANTYTLLKPYTYAEPVEDWGALALVSTIYDGVGLKVAMVNGLGDLTGGHASNTLTFRTLCRKVLTN